MFKGAVFSGHSAVSCRCCDFDQFPFISQMMNKINNKKLNQRRETVHHQTALWYDLRFGDKHRTEHQNSKCKQTEHYCTTTVCHLAVV